MNTLSFSKGEALLPAIAYGDTAGLPVETRSAAYITDKYGRIDQLIPTSENPFYIGTYSPGLWSDDTQLSLAVAQGLIDANGFDIQTQVEQHIRAYDFTPEIERRGIQVKRGWGRSTIEALERLKSGVGPRISGTKDGAGNGVLMKMAPLAYWQAVRGVTAEERYKQYDTLTTMTHDSDIARLTTSVHGDILVSLMENGYDRQRFINTLSHSIGLHAFRLGLNQNEQSSVFRYLKGGVTKDTILAHTDAKGFYAPQTLAMAYGAFVAHDAEIESSIYEAVNLGGDTDSTASIVAAMAVFAADEKQELPADSIAIDQLAMLQRVSTQLAQKANNLL